MQISFSIDLMQKEPKSVKAHVINVASDGVVVKNVKIESFFFLFLYIYFLHNITPSLSEITPYGLRTGLDGQTYPWSPRRRHWNTPGSTINPTMDNISQGFNPPITTLSTVQPHVYIQLFLFHF
jgi:hypothetical protein